MRVGPGVRDLRAGAREILLRLDVAAGRDEHAHVARLEAVTARLLRRSARVRSTATPTSFCPRIAPGLLTDSRTHSTPNSSRIEQRGAMRQRLHQLELRRCSTKAMSRLATFL